MRFCLVHSSIGRRQKFRGVAAGAREGGDSDARADHDPSAVRDPKLDRLDALSDPLGDDEGFGQRRLRHQDGELVAAKPGGQVVVADRAPNRLRNSNDHLVTNEVAVAIVDVAEQVEIRDCNRKRPPEAAGTVDFVAAYRAPVLHIGQFRFRIGASFLLERRNEQRSVDEEERAERERHEPRIGEQEEGAERADRHQRDVSTEILQVERAGLR